VEIIISFSLSMFRGNTSQRWLRRKFKSQEALAEVAKKQAGHARQLVSGQETPMKKVSLSEMDLST
jgi:hypothetical protein